MSERYDIEFVEEQRDQAEASVAPLEAALGSLSRLAQEQGVKDGNEITYLRSLLWDARAKLRDLGFGNEICARIDAAISASPSPDPVEAMRARCEEIARMVGRGAWKPAADMARSIADEIAALKGNGEGK